MGVYISKLGQYRSQLYCHCRRAKKNHQQTACRIGLHLLVRIPSASSQHSKISKWKRITMDKPTDSRRRGRFAPPQIPHGTTRQQEARPPTPSSMVVEPPPSSSLSPEWLDRGDKPCHDTYSSEDAATSPLLSENATEIANKLEGICIATREPDNERIGSFENGTLIPHPSMQQSVLLSSTFPSSSSSPFC